MELSQVKEQFQKENDDLLKFMLSERFFSVWKEPLNKDFNELYSLYNESYIELYITNKCNQACEYCYLHNNNEIYPEEVNNEETILSNLESFYSWVIKNDFHIRTIDFFSGEIWHTKFGLEILELTYRALLSGLHCKEFMIPTNGTFVIEDRTLQPIQKYINEFQNLGSRLKFSLSIDGAIIEEDNRPIVNGLMRPNDFYEKIFSFVIHNNYCFHPMVAAYSIEKWPENFKWWKQMIKKYGCNNSVHSAVMMLEVRNNDWTSEKIEKYCDFLEVLAEDFYYDKCKGNAEIFSRFCIGENLFGENYSYVPWTLSKSLEKIPCSASTSLTVRLGDLAICPCHRTAYKKNIYGYFVLNENKEIKDIVSNNIYFANRILFANNNLCSIKCDTCLYNSFCIKGCLGAQIESSKDAFLPIENVCKFFRKKYRTNVKIYEKYGVLDYIKNMPKSDSFYLSALKILEFSERVKKENDLEE